MAQTFKVFPDEDLLAQSVSSLAVADILQGLAEKSIFHLALTGGKSGNLVSDFLCREFNEDPSRFAGLHIWWGDERFVATTSTERNDYLLNRNMRQNSFIHLHPVLSPEAVDDVEMAAKRYNTDLVGIEMDLGVFGVGPDGHIASLFPALWKSDEGRSDEERSVIAIRDSPKPPPQRVTFTMRKINSINRLWMIAAGESKRELVEKIVAADMQLPVCHARGVSESLIFVDQASAPI